MEFESPIAALESARLMQTIRRCAYGWDRSMAEDLVQDVALHFIQRWDRFPVKTTAILTTVAKNRMRDVMRRESRYEKSLDVDSIARPSESECPAEFLAAMKPEHRLVVFLANSWRMSQNAIARALGMSREIVARLQREATIMRDGAPAWRNPRHDIFVALCCNAEGEWVRVAQCEAPTREAAVRILRTLAPDAEIVGSDMRTETMSSAATTGRKNNKTGNLYFRTFRIPNFIHEAVSAKADELGIARWDVYGAYLTTALLKPKNVALVERRMMANHGKVVSHPTNDQSHFQAAFVDAEECDKVRNVAKELVAKFRPGDMFFAYHVYQIALWLCLQGDINVSDAALERRR